VAILSKGNLLKIGNIEEIKESTGTSTFEEAFIRLVENSNE
jgi:ABC-type Na+ transport system ATPase subunit NatA